MLLPRTLPMVDMQCSDVYFAPLRYDTVGPSPSLLYFFMGYQGHHILEFPSTSLVTFLTFLCLFFLLFFLTK